MKLLRRLRRRKESFAGFDYEGQVFRPGDVVPVEALWPEPDYPRTPVLIECAGPADLIASDRRAWKEHGRTEHLYLLWRYSARWNDWVEIARARCAHWQWPVELRAIIQRAITGEMTPPTPPVVAERIRAMLDRTLDPLDPPQRKQALSLLHDEFAWRMADAS